MAKKIRNNILESIIDELKEVEQLEENTASDKVRIKIARKYIYKVIGLDNDNLKIRQFIKDLKIIQKKLMYDPDFNPKSIDTYIKKWYKESE